MASASHRGGGGNAGGRADDPEHRHHRRPYVSPYGAGALLGGPGLVSSYPLAYADTTGSDDSGGAPDQPTSGSAGEYESQPEEGWPQPPPIPYQQSADLPGASTAQASEEAVTIIFKDGRPAEQIHNYILTRATLFVGDSKRREIPTDQLDLTATAKVNQDAGVDFRLPDVPR